MNPVDIAPRSDMKPYIKIDKSLMFAYLVKLCYDVHNNLFYEVSITMKLHH